METEKLYYNDGKLSAFTATVLECREAKDGWDVVLDRTAFYPEGGGQPCDRGTLERLEVLDVQEQKNCILHRLEQPLLPGTEVRGQVDLARRPWLADDNRKWIVSLPHFKDEEIKSQSSLGTCVRSHS